MLNGDMIGRPEKMIIIYIQIQIIPYDIQTSTMSFSTYDKIFLIKLPTTRVYKI